MAPRPHLSGGRDRHQDPARQVLLPESGGLSSVTSRRAALTTPKHTLPGQRLIQHEPKGVEIRAAIERLAAGLLRAEISDFSFDQTRLGLMQVALSACDPEIEELG